MWVFMSDAFLSIVAHRDKPGVMMVRARVKGDIERVFPGVKEKRTPAADYLYRAEIDRDHVSKVMAEQIDAVDYDNFKNSVDDHERHMAYSGVWSQMLRLQYSCER